MITIFNTICDSQIFYQFYLTSALGINVIPYMYMAYFNALFMNYFI